MSKQEPLVSVIMPYFNLGDYLLEAVRSVLAQTYSNWELIVVDDASTENPADTVLATINDGRVKTFRNEKNQGNAGARNTAVSHSSGELLLPLDSDDLLKPNYIEEVLRAMQEAGTSAGYSNVEVFGMDSYVYIPSHNLPDIFSGHYPHNTLLVKREVYDAAGGYKALEAIVDTEFWISIIELGTKFAHVPQPLYRYRRHSASWTQTRKKTTYRDFCKVLLQHHQSMADCLPEVLAKMIERADGRSQTSDASLTKEYEHLHKEFHILLKRYETLEQQASKNEQILASVPKLIRQLSYVGLKKIGIR